MKECFSAKSVPILQFNILALRGEFHPHTSSHSKSGDGDKVSIEGFFDRDKVEIFKAKNSIEEYFGMETN